MTLRNKMAAILRVLVNLSAVRRYRGFGRFVGLWRLTDEAELISKDRLMCPVWPAPRGISRLCRVV